jgi:hypothetical protein
MDEKKRLKYLANAEEKFQKEQLQAAAAAEALAKSIAVIEHNKEELDPDQWKHIAEAISNRTAEIQEFLTNARDKYAAKLKELGDPRINPETGELV